MADALNDARGIPESIYKYRQWTKDPTRCLLRSRTLFFAAPHQFNDPFECSTEPNFEIASEQKLFESAMRRVRSQHPTVPAMRQEQLGWEMVWSLPRDENLANFHKLHAVWKSLAGIFSASLNISDDGHILLWSHYADGHKGYCVELDLETVMKEVFLDTTTGIPGAFYVEYNEEVPRMSFEIPSVDVDQIERLSDYSFMHKSREWSYEQEFRLVVSPLDFPGAEVQRNYKTSDSCIKSVFVGCRCENLDEIEEIVARFDPSPSLFRSVQSPNTFRIGYEQIG